MIRRRRYQARLYCVNGPLVGFLMALGEPCTREEASMRADRYNRLQLTKVYKGLQDGLHRMAVAEPCDCPAMGEDGEG